MEIEDDLLKALSIKSLFMSLSGLYVAIKLSLFFPSLNFWPLVTIFILLSLSFPIITYFERITDSVKVEKLYYLSSLFAGLLFLFLVTFLIHDVLNLFAWLLYDIILYGGFYSTLTMLAVLILFIYSFVNGKKLRVRQETIHSDKVAKSINIMHVSDVHIGAINLQDKLKRLVEKVNEQNPDLVCISGDLLDGSGLVNNSVMSPLNELEAKTFFVTGNHELYFGVDKACELISEEGIHILENQVVKQDGIQIVGVPYTLHQKSNKILGLDKLKEKVDNSKFSILLYHTPDGIEDFKESKIDLMLSGHTHKGQMYPFEYVIKLFYKYFYGFYKIDDQHINVSSGAGTWGPPMRLGTQNEIITINIKPKKS